MSSMLFSRKSHTTGLPPGTLVFDGEVQDREVEIEIYNYDSDTFEEFKDTDLEKIAECAQISMPSWINIDGLHDVELIERIGEIFGVPDLVLEDILSLDHHAKFEETDSYAILILRMLSFTETKQKLINEQVSIIWGENFTLSLQQWDGDVFDPLRKRLRSGKGRLRRHNSDYMTYALTDVIVDHYFVVLEEIVRRIDEMEDRLLNDDGKNPVGEIHKIRQLLLEVARAVLPLREAIMAMRKSDSEAISHKIEPFMLDLTDHINQVLELVESNRDHVRGLMDMHQANLANRMNEVMEVLTMVSTVFIPITFIAGIYGMNFVSMPELHQPWGYPAALTVMASIAVGMFIFFKNKRWL